MSDEYSDIDPITINSEKELALEFDNFSKILIDTGNLLPFLFILTHKKQRIGINGLVQSSV